MRCFSPMQFLNRVVEPTLAGVVVGEIAFIVLFESGETDFWQHYQAAGELLRQTPIQSYNYPAATVALFLPFTFASAPVARLIWLGISYLAFALAFRLLPPTRDHVLMWLAWPPVFISVAAGQLDCLVLLSIGIAWSLYDRKQDVKAGLVLALGLVKVHLLIPFLIIGVLQPRRKWLEGFLPVALLFGILSILLPQSYPDQVNLALRWYIQNPRGLGLPSRVTQIPTMDWLALVVLLGLAWLVLAIKNSRLAWLAMPLVQPYFLLYDLVLVTPALAASRSVPIFYGIIGVVSLWESRVSYVAIGLCVLLMLEFLSQSRSTNEDSLAEH